MLFPCFHELFDPLKRFFKIFQRSGIRKPDIVFRAETGTRDNGNARFLEQSLHKCVNRLKTGQLCGFLHIRK